MFKIITNKAIAIDSPDHLNPFGSILSDSTWSPFNKKLYKLFDKKPSILDIGCAGGSFIQNCIQDGCEAVGIEGSDIPFKRSLGSWPIYYNKNLFTCDVTEEFQIYSGNEKFKFDCVTTWEFFEHIHMNKIDLVMKNITNHLKTGGYLICSINTASKNHSDYIYGKDWGPSDIFPDKHFHHQNVNTPLYWDEKFISHGFITNNDLQTYFDKDYVRGPGHGADINATEERMNVKNLPLLQQWATINRVLQYVK